MEMPSVDWVDVADNWFGGCCTSFGGAGEKLVSQFISAYGRLEGTSLLDATAITVETDYLEANLMFQVACSPLGRDFVDMKKAIFDVSDENDHTAGKIKLKNSEEQAKIIATHAQPPTILEEGLVLVIVKQMESVLRLISLSLLRWKLILMCSLRRMLICRWEIWAIVVAGNYLFSILQQSLSTTHSH